MNDLRILKFITDISKLILNIPSCIIKTIHTSFRNIPTQFFNIHISNSSRNKTYLWTFPKNLQTFKVQCRSKDIHISFTNIHIDVLGIFLNVLLNPNFGRQCNKGKRANRTYLKNNTICAKGWYRYYGRNVHYFKSMFVMSVQWD